MAWSAKLTERSLAPRDATYMTSINHCEVCTVWIALDDTDEEIGTLEYVHESRKWSLTKEILMVS